MFTFQDPPFFASATEIEDVSDAQIVDFKPFYHSSRFATQYHSTKNPLCYADYILIQPDDIVLHLIEENGRVVRAEPARVWNTLYYDDGAAIGVVLVQPNIESHNLSDFYTFSILDPETQTEKWYYQNHTTFNQEEITRKVAFLCRECGCAQMWQPHTTQDNLHNTQLQQPIHYPQDDLNHDFFQSAVSRHAKTGNPACLFTVAMWLREQKKFPQAILGLQKAAEKGFAHAWLELGLEYLNDGMMLEDNPEKATTCFLKAAEGGCALGSYYLGLAYVEGVGIEQNDILALEQFEKAVAGHISDAYLKLALYYYNGSWNHLRAPSSPFRQSIANVAQQFDRAAHLFYQSTQSHHEDAAVAVYYLAECYRVGSGVVSDKIYARELYRIAAEQGDVTREEIQAAIYYNGDVERLKQVAAAGFDYAHYLLGRMFWFGEFAPLDLKAAYEHLYKAAASSHPCAEDAANLLDSYRMRVAEEEAKN